MSNNQNNGCGCDCNCNPKPENIDIQMDVCDRNINMLPMLQTYTTKVLQPNMRCNKNVLTQEMLSCENYKYVIKWDFDLCGETITVPDNCILDFDGGSLNNGTLLLNNTIMTGVVLLNNIEHNNSYRLQKAEEEDVVYVKDYILASDGDDLGPAIQRAINAVGNGVTNSSRVRLPKGRWKVKTPSIIDCKEGIIIEGAGKYNTVLEADGDMLYDDHLGYPDSYAKNAFFIVVLQREFGSANNLKYYGSSENFLTFKDFSCVDEQKRKSISAIFCYGMASSVFQDIYCSGLKYFIEYGHPVSQEHWLHEGSVGSWVCRFICISCHDGHGFFNCDRGTSLYLLNCSILNCDEGYIIKNTQYTTLQNCTCELWGSNSYAYRIISAANVSLIGCGCEQGHGGIYKVEGYDSSVSFIECMLQGVQENNLGDNHQMYISGYSSVVFNNSSIRSVRIEDGAQHFNKHNFREFCTIIINGEGRKSDRGIGQDGTDVTISKNYYKDADVKVTIVDDFYDAIPTLSLFIPAGSDMKQLVWNAIGDRRACQICFIKVAGEVTNDPFVQLAGLECTGTIFFDRGLSSSARATGITATAATQPASISECVYINP